MQDNESSVLLHNHHPFSVGKGSKHINMRHFFVVDKIEKKEVKIFFRTDYMVADFSAKTLQGRMLVVNRDEV